MSYIYIYIYIYDISSLRIKQASKTAASYHLRISPVWASLWRRPARRCRRPGRTRWLTHLFAPPVTLTRNGQCLWSVSTLHGHFLPDNCRLAIPASTPSSRVGGHMYGLCWYFNEVRDSCNRQLSDKIMTLYLLSNLHLHVWCLPNVANCRQGASIMVCVGRMISTDNTACIPSLLTDSIRNSLNVVTWHVTSVIYYQ